MCCCHRRRGAAPLESLMFLSAIRSLLHLFQISPSRHDSGKQELPHTTTYLPGICFGSHACGRWRSPEGIHATLRWEACSVVAKEPICLWRGLLELCPSDCLHGLAPAGLGSYVPMRRCLHHHCDASTFRAQDEQARFWSPISLLWGPQDPYCFCCMWGHILSICQNNTTVPLAVVFTI